MAQYMARSSETKVLHLDSASSNRLEKNAAGFQLLFTHFITTNPVAQSKASTEMLIDALMA